MLFNDKSQEEINLLINQFKYDSPESLRSIIEEITKEKNVTMAQLFDWLLFATVVIKHQLTPLKHPKYAVMSLFHEYVSSFNNGKEVSPIIMKWLFFRLETCLAENEAPDLNSVFEFKGAFPKRKSHMENIERYSLENRVSSTSPCYDSHRKAARRSEQALRSMVEPFEPYFDRKELSEEEEKENEFTYQEMINAQELLAKAYDSNDCELIEKYKKILLELDKKYHRT